jgi:hypothetical protein
MKKKVLLTHYNNNTELKIEICSEIFDCKLVFDLIRNERKSINDSVNCYSEITNFFSKGNHKSVNFLTDNNVHNHWNSSHTRNFL